MIATMQGAPDRVARVHRQARPTLLVAFAFVAAAPVAVVLPHETGAWLPLHLFLVGGLLSAISGATQMLAVTWSSSPAPADRVVAVQRAAVVLGTLGLVVGRERDADLLAGAGGALVAVGLVLLAALLWTIRSGAVTDRYLPAIDGYLLALGFGVVGVAVGVHMALEGTASADLRRTHLIVNLLGLVGLVILATLPFFAATQVRSKMSPRARPARVRGLVVTSAAVVAGAAAAAATGRQQIAAGLLAVESVVILGSLLLVPSIGRRQLGWAGPRIVQLFAGVVWWSVAVAGFAATVAWDLDDDAVLRAMAIGGLAQILAASLGYLGPVLRGGGHERLTAGFATTRSWTGVVAANVAALGALLQLRTLVVVGLGVWLLDGAVRGSRLVLDQRRRAAPEGEP